MFSIDKNSMAITMHQGDTGAFYLNARRVTTGADFSENDRLMFTVKAGDTPVISRYYSLTDEDENGRVLVAFRNSDTDSLLAGTYRTEVRVAIDPVWLDGEIVDGSTVRTVIQSTLTLIDVLKKV